MKRSVWWACAIALGQHLWLTVMTLVGSVRVGVGWVDTPRQALQHPWLILTSVLLLVLLAIVHRYVMRPGVRYVLVLVPYAVLAFSPLEIIYFPDPKAYVFLLVALVPWAFWGSTASQRAEV